MTGSLIISLSHTPDDILHVSTRVVVSVKESLAVAAFDESPALREWLDCSPPLVRIEYPAKWLYAVILVLAVGASYRGMVLIYEENLQACKTIYIL